MSQYKDLGTPVNGPQAKRRGYLTQQEDEERQQELTKRLLQERLDSDARNKLERERNVIRNAYQAPNPFVEPEVPVPTTTTEPVETFIGTPATDPAVWAALAAAREKLEAVMASDNACGDEDVLDGAEDTGETSDDAPEQL
jgi:hypothetical protein